MAEYHNNEEIHYDENVIRTLHSLPKKGLFSSFVTQPKNLKFQNQEQNEEILLLLRRHPITNVPWILIGVLFFIAPFFYLFLPFFNFLPKQYFPIILIGWYLFSFAFVFENFLLWFYNINIVTNQRVIDIDFYNILYKEVSDARLKNIQDVSYNQNGFIEAFFNFGDVFIQTAAEKNEFVFENISSPNKVVSIISLLLGKVKQHPGKN